MSLTNKAQKRKKCLNGDDDESFSENDNLQDEIINNNTDKILNTNLPKGHSLVIAKKKRRLPSKIGENIPVSSTLDKIKSFLPILEQANKQLEEKPPEEVQIEWKEEEERDEPHIEMEFALTELDNEGEEEEEEDEKEEEEENNNNNKKQLISEL